MKKQRIIPINFVLIDTYPFLFQWQQPCVCQRLSKSNVNVEYCICAAPGHNWINENEKKNHLYARAHSVDGGALQIHNIYDFNIANMKTTIEFLIRMENNRWMCVCVSQVETLNILSSLLEMCIKLMLGNDNSNSSSNSTGICCLCAAYLAMCLLEPSLLNILEHRLTSSVFWCVCYICVDYWELKKEHLIHFYWDIWYRCVCYMCTVCSRCYCCHYVRLCINPL